MLLSLVANMFAGKDSKKWTPADFFPSLAERATVETTEAEKPVSNQGALELLRSMFPLNGGSNMPEPGTVVFKERSHGVIR